jgi:hypothetical protein
MIGESGAGAKPVPYKILTAEKLADGIKQCLTDEAREAAGRIANDIEAEGDGAKNAVTSFHRSLVLRGQHSMRCSVRIWGALCFLFGNVSSGVTLETFLGSNNSKTLPEEVIANSPLTDRSWKTE